MRPGLFIAGFVSVVMLSKAQHLNTDTVGLRTVSDNLYNKPLFGDSLASSFVIIIKKEVKAHKHLSHSEHVVVLEGSGTMTLWQAQGDKEKVMEIKKGDVIFIPKNTIHAVKSNGKQPLKVLSVQSPYFDGKDRIFIE
jgi:mannose-6-phosphate isomerase-like protein (cupin superfamily)